MGQTTVNPEPMMLNQIKGEPQNYDTGIKTKLKVQVNLLLNYCKLFLTTYPKKDYELLSSNNLLNSKECISYF